MSFHDSINPEDEPMEAAPAMAWLLIEERLRQGGQSEAAILAFQGMYANGYEQGIVDVMTELNGVHDVMGAVSVVNGLLRTIRDVKDEAQTNARVIIALRKMKLPQEKADGSKRNPEGPGEGKVGGSGEGAPDAQEPPGNG